MIGKDREPMRKNGSLRRSLHRINVKAEKAMKAAVAETIRDHARTGDPLAIWCNDKVAWVPAHQLLPKRRMSPPRYDEVSDVVSIGTVSQASEKFVEVVPGVHVELGKRGDAIGIKILKASTFFKPITKSLCRHIQITA